MVISLGLRCPKDPARLAAIPGRAADNDHDDVEFRDVRSRTRERLVIEFTARRLIRRIKNESAAL
jgi:hypothetical protein